MDSNEANVTANGPETNSIDNYRLELLQNVDATCAEIRNKRELQGYNSTKSFSERLYGDVTALVRESSPLFPIDIFEVEFIERSAFQADIALKSTHLLSTDKGAYFKDH